MAPTYWIVLAAGLVFVAVVAFVLGRKTATGEARARDLEHELQRTREELASVREGVSDHFEQSARIFGRLAGEYRAFYEHFTETARSLGISERRASELLQQADPQQVTAHEPDSQPDEGAAGVVGEDDGSRAGASVSPEGMSPESISAESISAESGDMETEDSRVRAAERPPADAMDTASSSPADGERTEEGSADGTTPDDGSRAEPEGDDTDERAGKAEPRNR